ncbi:MAG TPA: hypothetical protein VFR70_06940 [Flavobacterium sp.]|nr:hypothetical protein [Flavobacterium sp.]
MKKSLPIFIAVILLAFTSCRITKTLTMINAKSVIHYEDADFYQGKADAISFLILDDSQKEKAVQIWKAEKQGLNKIDASKNSEIAPIIYKSENDFRAILTAEQLKAYKGKLREAISPNSPYFLNDRQLEELKRIYDL